MGDVCDKEAVRVGFVAGEANGGAAGGGVHRGVVDAQIDLAVVCVDEASRASGRLRLVGDIAGGRVSAGEEGEAGEEVGGGVAVD